MSLNIQADATAFLGSNALSVFISAVETGIVIVFFARFIARKKEKLPIQILVYFVTFVAMFQMSLTFASWWSMSVVHFGNWAAVAKFGWPHKLHYALTVFIAAPVQLFLIWRCWHVSLNRRPFIAFFLVFLVVGSIATSVYIMVENNVVHWHAGNNQLAEARAYYSCFILSLSFSAVTDFSVTGILLMFLVRSRSEIHSRHYRNILFRLIIITWESAIPPCTFAIAALIAGAVGAPVISDWAIMLQTILGKLYLISLFVSLEGRAALSRVAHRTHFPTLSNVSRNGAGWPSNTDETDNSDPSKQSLPLAFLPHKMVIASDPGAEVRSWDPESSDPHTV